MPVKARPYYLIIVPILLSCTPCFVSFHTTDQKTITQGDSLVRFYVMEDIPLIKPKQNTIYTWFRSGKIEHNVGGIGGPILRGTYLVYSSQSSLRTKGKFRRGYKKGKWTSWYPNGMVEKKYNFSRGWLEGRREEYSEEGRLIAKGAFKKGKPVGKHVNYDQGKARLVQKFKKGELKHTKILGNE